MGAAEKMVRPGDVPGKETQYDSVTLLVTPLEAARLMVGQKMGSYRIVLRGAKDSDKVAMPTLRSSDFMPSALKGRDNGVEFIVGGKGDKMVSQMPTSPSQEMAARAARQRLGRRRARPANAAGGRQQQPEHHCLHACATRSPSNIFGAITKQSFAVSQIRIFMPTISTRLALLGCALVSSSIALAAGQAAAPAANPDSGAVPRLRLPPPAAASVAAAPAPAPAPATSGAPTVKGSILTLSDKA
ncbi:hypothetical protein LP419_11230 [Massilia sp. H-1]|nr:hypothetical protein LP419_11230 [Massilia sp. H-1]